MSKRTANSLVQDNCSDIKKQKAAVQFKQSWLNELIATETMESEELQYVRLGQLFSYSEDNGILCLSCVEAKSSCDFAKGKKWGSWKIDYLKRHLNQKVHLEGVRELRRIKLRSGINHLMMDSANDRKTRVDFSERRCSQAEQVKILIDNVLLAISMNSSMLSVQDIHDHLAKYITLPESWRSKNYAFEFVECINHVVQQNVINEIRDAAYHTLIVDESANISTSKMLILYMKFRSSKSYKTMFAGIMQLIVCDSQSICTAIKQFYADNKLDLQKMVMFMSDGASVILGKHKGVAALLKQEIPHLTDQQCVAHREDLGIDDAWKHASLKDIDTLLCNIYTTFCRSSVKRSQFDEMAKIADCDAVAFRPLNEVRWSSRHFAISALIRNYEALIQYYSKEVADENDPMAKYCLKMLKNPQVHVSVAILNDVLTELAELCCIFQRSCITPLEASEFAKAKLRKLRAQYLGDIAHFSTEVKGIIGSIGCEVNTDAVLCFVERVCDQLENGFPDGELKEWVAFDMSALKQGKQDYTFGNEEVQNLVTKYKKILKLPPLPHYQGSANEPELLDLTIEAMKMKMTAEYNEFKFVVLEKLKAGTLKTFLDIVTYTLTDDKFTFLAQLLDICGTFQASSAEAERGFNLMNNIKSQSRKRLEVSHLNMLMRIRSYLTAGFKVDLDSVYVFWKCDRDRRQKVRCR